MIEFKNVSKKYKNGTHALEDINLKVNDGEFVYIMGPTGSGKSTLIKLLDGEEVPTGGSVIVNGVNVGRLRKSKVYLYRRKIGVVFQDYRLLPEKTVFENVAYALEVLDLPNDKIRKRTREVLKLVDLADKANVKPRELSGGQQQRVAIARAIAKRPTILIADEPTGNLDPSMTDEMIRLLEKINTEEKTTLLVVTHNDVMVEYHPKRTIRIDSGHIVNDGSRTLSFYKQNLTQVKGETKKEETVTEENVPQQTIQEEVKIEAPVTEASVSNVSEQEAALQPSSVQTELHRDRDKPKHVRSDGSIPYDERPIKERHLSKEEAQDEMINEITMQLDAIKEISEGGRE